MWLTVIDAFEVPPEADEAFVTGWERDRDFLAAMGGFSATVLHRALRADSEFRFVDVARVDSAQAWQHAIADPAFPGGAMPFKSRHGLYEVAHEDGRPAGRDGVVLIDPFEVPEDEDDRFLTAWGHARDVLATQPGYLGTQLHRSVAAADFRFVDVARWSSPLALAKAVRQPAFLQAAMPFASHASLYQVIRA